MEEYGQDQTISKQGDAFLIESATDRTQREDSLRKQRDSQHQNVQAVFTKRMFWLSLALGLVANGVSFCTANIARDAAEATKDAVDIAGKTLDANNESFDKTLQEMKAQSTAMQVAAEAAEKTAKATEVSNRLTSASLRLTREVLEKPVVLLSRIELSKIQEAIEPTVLVCFKNVGRTLATGFRMGINIRFEANDEITEQEFRRIGVQGFTSIGPGSEVCLPFGYGGRAFNKTEMEDWVGNRRNLFIFGPIIYGGPDGQRTEYHRYVAQYIKWEQPRPSGIPDFYIANDPPLADRLMFGPPH